MSAVSAEVITEDGRLAALAPQWWDLWRRDPIALPFQSPAWLLAWRRHFALGPLFTLAAWQNDRLVALAPGYIELGAIGRRILPLGISLSDHLDILADPVGAEPGLAALAAAALTHREAWEVWELEELPPGANALSLPLPSGCADSIAPQSTCPVLQLAPGGPGIAHGSPTKRRHLVLARNRAARRGAVAIERADQASAGEALEHLFRLHNKRWQSRGVESALASAEVQAFQREATPLLLAAGLLRLYVLRIAGEVAAAHYGLTHGATSSVYLTGFDPAFAFESPGLMLMAHAIDEAAAEGMREFDFLRGPEAYKYRWGAVDRWNMKRSIRRSPHG